MKNREAASARTGCEECSGRAFTQHHAASPAAQAMRSIILPLLALDSTDDPTHRVA